MSLRLLQKQVGATPSEGSSEAKDATQPHGRGRLWTAGRGGGARDGGGGYYGDGGGGAAGGRGRGGGGGGSYGDAGAGPSCTGDFGARRSAGASAVLAPPPASGSRFAGSDAQRAHVEAMKRATADASPAASTMPTDVAVKSHLGLDALRERKRKEEEEKQAKREAARARRHDEATKKEVDDEQTLAECEEQAWRDAEGSDRVKYEAALIVRIAVRFGTGGVWMKIAEARARGAEIPLDPRRVYLLAHPDKCPLAEASDATAILNAQRPPEMTEAKVRPKAAARAPAPAAAGAFAAEAPAAAAAAASGASGGAAEGRAAAAEPQDGAASAGVVAPGPAGPAGPTEPAERRTDPEDGQACNLDELRQKYSGAYSPEDVQTYWDLECRPAAPPKPPKPKPPGSRRF